MLTVTTMATVRAIAKVLEELRSLLRILTPPDHGGECQRTQVDKKHCLTTFAAQPIFAKPEEAQRPLL